MCGDPPWLLEERPPTVLGGRYRVPPGVKAQGLLRLPGAPTNRQSPQDSPPGRAAQAQQPVVGCHGQTCWLQAPCLRPRLSHHRHREPVSLRAGTRPLCWHLGSPPRRMGDAPHRPALVPTSSWPLGLNHLVPTGTLHSAARHPGQLGVGWEEGVGGHSSQCWPSQGRREDPLACCLLGGAGSKAPRTP